MAAQREKMIEMLEPVVESLGYELVLLDFNASSKHGLLRLYIDAPGGITLEDCERVSREVAARLDVEDPIPAAYQLEVSSPGLDRPLVKPAHFERFIGRQAKVQLLVPQDGRRKFAGHIRAAGETSVRLETPEGPVELKYADMERARLVPEYSE